MTVIVRFAPSPTGFLHIGNVRTALQNACFARQQGGKFILRVDDTDKERSEKQYETAIKEDLNWLGVSYQEVFNQSERFSLYDEAAQYLKTEGYLYPCYETPEELDRKRRLARAQGKPPVYDRAALSLSEDQKKKMEAEGYKPHWRFKLSGNQIHWKDLVRGEQTIETASLSDPILIRGDGSYLYTLPSVVDDCNLKITHVVRGEDHVTNSGAQIEIFKALGFSSPAFAHTPLLVGVKGEALSKRLGSLTVKELREKGMEPMVIASLLVRIGTSDAICIEQDFKTLAATFDFEKIGRAPARFSEQDLERLNRQFLHTAPYEYYQEKFEKSGVSETLWNIVRANLNTIHEVDKWKEIIEGSITPVITDQNFIEQAIEILPKQEFDLASWKSWTNELAEKTGRKGKALYLPLRQALTGLSFGPSMDELLVLIGYEKTLKRLKG